jgi:hypothetical protein
VSSLVFKDQGLSFNFTDSKLSSKKEINQFFYATRGHPYILETVYQHILAGSFSHFERSKLCLKTHAYKEIYPTEKTLEQGNAAFGRHVLFVYFNGDFSMKERINVTNFMIGHPLSRVKLITLDQEMLLRKESWGLLLKSLENNDPRLCYMFVVAMKSEKGVEFYPPVTVLGKDRDF